METIKEAKGYLRENADKGVSCPCCNQFVKVYKRGLTGTSSHGLILLYKAGGAERFIHVPRMFAGHKLNMNGGDLAKARFWGLIEAMPNNDEAKRTSGFWKITPKGIDFITNKTKIFRKAKFYNQKFLGFDEESGMADIQETLGKKFNYHELMRA